MCVYHEYVIYTASLQHCNQLTQDWSADNTNNSVTIHSLQDTQAGAPLATSPPLPLPVS